VSRWPPALRSLRPLYGDRGRASPGLGIASLLLLPLLKRIRRGARCFSLWVAVVCLAFSLSGCGGASMTTPSNPAPLTTPAGTYQLTVTATAGASQVKQSLTLAVQ
jgi:hypothetical protein